MKEIKISGGVVSFPDKKNDAPFLCSPKVQELVEKCLMEASSTYEAIALLLESDNLDAIIWSASYGIAKIISESKAVHEKVDITKYKERANSQIKRRYRHEFKNYTGRET